MTSSSRRQIPIVLADHLTMREALKPSSWVTFNMYVDHWSPGSRLGRLPVSPAFANAMFYRAPAAALTDLHSDLMVLAADFVTFGYGLGLYKNLA
ncbi:hypothetical protein HanPI659440_Chr07g0268911 [Helianthus annuus]|nr:hypothetical protein HanPI659440_Chr07g0268911 [Helianthus annuus]